MKKLLSVLGAFVMCVAMSFAFVGCGSSSQATKTLEVDMNPNIMLVMDDNNKITSVEFKTEETNQIFIDVDFTGKSLDQALELFVNYSLISGHLTLTGEEVTITGTAATEEALTAIKDAAETALKNAFDQIGVDVQVTKVEKSLTEIKEALHGHAQGLAPDRPHHDLEKMSVAELTKLIDEKQKEYKGLTYQQIQEIEAMFEEGGAEAALKTALDLANDAFASAQSALEEAQSDLDDLKATLGNDNPAVQAAQTAVNQAQTVLNQAKTAFNEALSAFNERKAELIAQAKQAYNEAKEALKTAYKTKVENAKIAVENHLDTAVEGEIITAEQAQKIKDLIAQYAPEAQ